MKDDQPLTISTPRRSYAGLVVTVLLLLLSVGLFYFAYWGWQQHQAIQQNNTTSEY